MVINNSSDRKGGRHERAHRGLNLSAPASRRERAAIPQRGFSRIIAATDFSPRSEKAVDYAVQLAQRLGARLTLVHVHPEPADYALGQIPIWYWQEVRAAMKAKLAEQLARSRRFYPAVEAQLRTAHDFHEELLAVARELRADLLVLATHGSFGWKHLLFGSDAEQILERAPCPILVVR